MKKILAVLFSATVVLGLAACSQTSSGTLSASSFDPDSVAPPEYNEAQSWLAQPDEVVDYAVDVFWVYPTIFASDTDWLMDPTDPELIAKAQDTIVAQASVFTDGANLYAPLYRQMNIAGLSQPDDVKEEMLQPGEDDVWRAFQFYLDYLNNGRPFILAGHSQGSNIIADLLCEKWGTTGAEDQLVAAYIIGWSVTPDDLAQNSNLKICENGEETGCIITYNSVADGMQGSAPTLIAGTWVTNPLNWESAITDGTLVPASENLGSVFFNDDGTATTYSDFTSAQIMDSGLVCDVADTSLVQNAKGGFPQGVYHGYDYSLFYENLKANVAERIEAFLDSK